MIFGSRKRGRDAFQQEALSHLDALYYAARYMTRDPGDAEDLVQETLLKAFRFWDRYEAGTNCKAWLFRIMTNTHINRQRGKARQFAYLENLDVDGGEGIGPLAEASAFYKNPEQGYLHGLIHDRVKAALQSIPVDFRTPVVLADLQDFSYKEIAEIMDCPIGTVMSRLHRGRRMLRKKLRTHAIDQGILPADSTDPEAPDAPTSLQEYRDRKTKRTTSA